MRGAFSRFNIWLLGILVICVGWIVYSYSQVDLNLTLSTQATYQVFQQLLIQLGYFQRPLSTVIFLSLLFVSSFFYRQVLIAIRNKQLTEKQLWQMIGITLLLIFAYPAFSHDIFNYMFDARIVTRYGLDPHFFRALDFPMDQWTRFMRWTHRYYPYGPAWLWVSFVPSFLGFEKFVLTLFLFKGMFALFHVTNCFLIKKIVHKTMPERALLAVGLFAFNPLVIVESIMSPHNETLMLLATLLGIYFFLQHKKGWAVVAFVFGGLTKFLSFIAIPIFYVLERKKNVFLIFYVAWWIALLPVIASRELYSWYLVPIVALSALTKNSVVQIVTIGLSFGAVYRYAPFLFYGNYDVATQYAQNVGLVFIMLIGSIPFFFLWKRKF